MGVTIKQICNGNSMMAPFHLKFMRTKVFHRFFEKEETLEFEYSIKELGVSFILREFQTSGLSTWLGFDFPEKFNSLQHRIFDLDPDDAKIVAMFPDFIYKSDAENNYEHAQSRLLGTEIDLLISKKDGNYKAQLSFTHNSNGYYRIEMTEPSDWCFEE